MDRPRCPHCGGRLWFAPGAVGCIACGWERLDLGDDPARMVDRLVTDHLLVDPARPIAPYSTREGRTR